MLFIALWSDLSSCIVFCFVLTYSVWSVGEHIIYNMSGEHSFSRCEFIIISFQGKITKTKIPFYHHISFTHHTFVEVESSTLNHSISLPSTGMKGYLTICFILNNHSQLLTNISSHPTWTISHETNTLNNISVCKLYWHSRDSQQIQAKSTFLLAYDFTTLPLQVMLTEIY